MAGWLGGCVGRRNWSSDQDSFAFLLQVKNNNEKKKEAIFIERLPCAKHSSKHLARSNKFNAICGFYKWAEGDCVDKTCPEYLRWRNEGVKLVRSSEPRFRVLAIAWGSVSSCLETLGRQTAHFLTAEDHTSVNNVWDSCLDFRVSVISCPLKLVRGNMLCLALV